jgi:hypothetical protein
MSPGRQQKRVGRRDPLRRLVSSAQLLWTEDSYDIQYRCFIAALFFFGFLCADILHYPINHLTGSRPN